MRYWVYINDKVTGPYEEDKISALEGFTPDTLICSEIIEEGSAQEWVPANSVLPIPDIVSDNVSERHIDTTGMSTGTYVAAKDVDFREMEKPKTAAAAAQENSAGPEEMLFEKISRLAREIDELRSEVKKLLSTPAGQPASARVEDPMEEALFEANPSSGKIMTHEDVVVEEAVKSEVKSIAENNTPPQMDIVMSGAGSEPVRVNPEQKSGMEDILRDEKIIDSFPASSILPELNESLNAKPEEKKETFPAPQVTENPADSLFEPVKLQPIVLEEIHAGKEESFLNHTFTAPLNTATEEESAVVASALDSLYRGPQAKPEPVKETKIDFEDLIKKDAPAPAAALVKDKNDSPAPVKDPAMLTMSEINLGSEKTSLISDFIPPSAMEKEDNKQERAVVQEIVSPDFTDEPTLHGAAIVKRIKPADIKTNPLISASKAAVAGPDTTDKINFMDQFGTEEESTAAPKSGAAKKIMTALLSIILLLIIAAGLMFARIIPDVFGLFTPKQADNNALNAPSAPQLPAQHESSMTESESQILMDAQNHVFPNGMTLMGAVAAKHPMQAGAVEWSVKQFDADNYRISAKVPPETDTSLMIIYNFNYTPATRDLKPLTSDSKNLLDMQ
ncbi:hypothetical protein FACS189437_03010 [Bacteroidia bacterium]|nr:hypothetical protein FACS189437_03010 [Bacteroidia bacterium]